MERNNQNKTLSNVQSTIYSILPQGRVSYPRWLDELFLRFAAIYQGRWTSMIQDPRMLEITKAEWFETLEVFECEVIKETLADVKKMPGDFPSIQKFFEIASAKAKHRKAEMAAQERKEVEGKILEHKGNPELAERARDEIRRLCGLKIVNTDKRECLSDDKIRKT